MVLSVLQELKTSAPKRTIKYFFRLIFMGLLFLLISVISVETRLIASLQSITFSFQIQSNLQLIQLLLGNRGGATAHHVATGVVLREGDEVADAVGAAEE